MPFSCRERAGRNHAQKPNDLAREAVSWNGGLGGSAPKPPNRGMHHRPCRETNNCVRSNHANRNHTQHNGLAYALECESVDGNHIQHHGLPSHNRFVPSGRHGVRARQHQKSRFENEPAFGARPAQRPALQLPPRRTAESVKIARILRAEGGQLQAPVRRQAVRVPCSPLTVSAGF